jgi:hypothetical protein
LLLDTREIIAQMIYEQCRKAQRKDQRDQMDEQPDKARWEELRVNFRVSNEQADQITVTEIECTMHEVGKENLKRTELPEFNDDETELIAEMKNACRGYH